MNTKEVRKMSTLKELFSEFRWAGHADSFLKYAFRLPIRDQLLERRIAKIIFRDTGPTEMIIENDTFAVIFNRKSLQRQRVFDLGTIIGHSFHFDLTGNILDLRPPDISPIEDMRVDDFCKQFLDRWIAINYFGSLLTLVQENSPILAG